MAFSTVIRTTITGIMLKPIQELESAAEKLKAGQLDVEINYESPDELGKLAGNFRAGMQNSGGDCAGYQLSSGRNGRRKFQCIQ